MRLKDKSALLYDSFDLVGSLFIIGIALLLTGLIIYGQRMETIDQKFILEENLEIMDEFMRFTSLPLDSFDYSSFRPSASVSDEKRNYYLHEYSVYHLFSLMYTEYYAFELLKYLFSKDDVLSRYQVHIPEFSLDYFRFEGDGMKKKSFYEYYSFEQSPLYPSVLSSVYNRCGVGTSEKTLVFSLPLIYNSEKISGQYELRYCHTLSYFDFNNDGGLV